MRHYSFVLTHFRGLGRNTEIFFVEFLAQMKTLKFAFEVNRPLASAKMEFAWSLGSFWFSLDLFWIHFVKSSWILKLTCAHTYLFSVLVISWNCCKHWSQLCRANSQSRKEHQLISEWLCYSNGPSSPSRQGPPVQFSYWGPFPRVVCWEKCQDLAQRHLLYG